MIHDTAQSLASSSSISPGDVVLWTDAQGRVTKVRAGDPRDLYLEDDDLVGKRVERIPDPEVSARFRHAYARARDTDDVQVFDYELTMRREPASFRATVLPLPQGGTVTILQRTRASVEHDASPNG